MIDIQRESSGIEIYVELLVDYDNFNDVKAQVLTPSGNIIDFATTKDTPQVAKFLLEGELTEIGLHELQVVGTSGAQKSFSEVGHIQVHRNLADL